MEYIFSFFIERKIKNKLISIIIKNGKLERKTRIENKRW